MPKRMTGDQPEFKPFNVSAAAIDIGSKMHMAAVNPDCADMPVRAFGTFTKDLNDLADWFKACGVTSVAMESTGSIGSRPTAPGQIARLVLQAIPGDASPAVS